jgi:hypothetical protein
MHRIFQDFIDHLSSAEDQAELSGAMAVTAAALDLSCFAYLALPQKLDGTPRLMSTYPKEWTSHYLRSHYERIDPVIMQALRDTEPFRWGIGSTERYLSPAQKRLLDEASQYGIRLDSPFLSMTDTAPLPPSPLPATNGKLNSNASSRRTLECFS